ncbi:phage virion morphogenesis protein [Thalassospira indica]|uniref:Phage virion morphogenesis protein n=1 Tax=Thalassospira indica TaxID=1891279 RepID=A0ABM6XVT6_9PROT|nr:phage virion morphogenesis protein [Thalassospira indica]AXO13775.1 phage virion morphogenesis protein [Thalassospira indica]
MAKAELHGFEQFDAWIESAIRALSPAGRKTLLRDIAREVRRRNQQRITKQQDPDGNKWQPRKPDREGNIRGAKKMMLGFRKARRMRIETTPSHAAVGFRGKTSQIASVHHYGAVDYVEKGGPRVKYPERRLLGIPTEDLHLIRQKLIDAIVSGK